MKSSVRFARSIQIGFWLSGVAFLAITYTGAFGLLGMGLSLALCVAFVGSAITLKCSQCGISYFFDPSTASWSMGGINLLRTVKSRCPKCGADRSTAP
jgi:hypothetical protein